MEYAPCRSFAWVFVMDISGKEREFFRCLPKGVKKRILLKFGSEDAAFSAGLVVYKCRVMIMPKRPACPELAFSMLDIFCNRNRGCKGLPYG